MQTRSFFRAKRWLDVIVYGAIGAAFFTYVAPHISEVASEKLQELFNSGKAASWILGVIGIAALFLANRLSGARLRHAKYLFVYPPLPVAVLVACGIAPMLPGIPAGSLKVEPFPLLSAGIASAVYTAVWCLQTGGQLLWEHFASRKKRVGADSTKVPISAGKLSDADLKAWLKREEPVDEQKWDLFNHVPLAEKLLERLEKGENTIALQGPFGSGKSSLAAMTRQLAEKKGSHLIFVKVSCWGFSDAARAQEEILSELIQEMRKELDCAAVGSIPSDYVEAIGEAGGWLKSLAQLGAGVRSPLQQLQRLSPLLAATGRLAVIFIEDVDRNGASFDLSQIQALLVQFREVEGISFVLAISPEQQIDFARLCEFVESVPMLEPHQVLPLIHQTREMLLREHPVAVLLDKNQPLVGQDDDFSILAAYAGHYSTWPLALCDLLKTPRHLKHALRRVADAWPRVSGEVRIDDLISMAALRVGAPEAFSFFSARLPIFRSAPDANSTQLRDEAKKRFHEGLTAEWKSLCERANFDIDAAAWIMKELFPQSYIITGKEAAYVRKRQSMGDSKRSRVYARRLLNEWLDPDEPRDQTILALLERSKQESSALRELAEFILGSKDASDLFEDFARHLEFSDYLLPLLTEVYAALREKYGAKIDLDEHPGFFAPWRLFHRYPLPTNAQVWLPTELKKCIPDHLRLLKDIYYYWLGTDKHTPDERRESRQAIYEVIKTAWLTMPPEKISKGFDPDQPYTLFHIVFTSDYEKPETVPYSDAKEWSWLGPVLLTAIPSAPEVMLPQVIVALNSTSSRGGDVPKYKFDDFVLDAWFGDRKREVVQLVASGFPINQSMTAQTQYLLKAAITEANKWLGSTGEQVPRDQAAD